MTVSRSACVMWQIAIVDVGGRGRRRFERRGWPAPTKADGDILFNDAAKAARPPSETQLRANKTFGGYDLN